MDNPKLNEIRKEINAIDNQLLPLLMRRMDAAAKPEFQCWTRSGSSRFSTGYASAAVRTEPPFKAFMLP